MKSVAIENYYPSNDGRLKIEWNLSKRCNFNCSYCSPSIHDNTSSWKSIDDYKGAVNKIVSCTDKETWLSFTGGEPVIYPKFKELIRYCKERSIHFISVCSNGSSKTEYYLELMEYLDNIIISCHFEYKVGVIDSILAIKEYIKDLDKIMHVHVMMLPGYFSEAMKVMDVLKDNDVQFGVRRIRPLYMPDGSVARPYQNGGNLKLTDGVAGDPDYSNDAGYYSDEELNFFRREIHEYI